MKTFLAVLVALWFAPSLALANKGAAPVATEKAQPDPNYVYAMQAYEYWRKLYDGNPDSAEKYFDTAFGALYKTMQRGSRDVHVLARLGDLYRAHNDCKNATDLLSEVASEIYRDFAGSQYERTIFIAFADCEEDHDKAITYYRKALSNAPGDAITTVSLAKRLLKKGQHLEADAMARAVLVDYDPVLSINAKATAYNVIGWVAFNQKNYHGALETFKTAAEIRKKHHPDDLLGLGWSAKFAGDEKAKKHYFMRLKMETYRDINVKRSLDMDTLKELGLEIERDKLLGIEKRNEMRAKAKEKG